MSARAAAAATRAPIRARRDHNINAARGCAVARTRIESEAGMAGQSKTTTDHNVIRKWADARGGQPATVRHTGSTDEPGILRIDFPGYSGGDSLEPISWEEFFQKFDEKHLAFLYQEETRDGEESRFFKLVSQGRAADDDRDKGKERDKKDKKA